MRHRMQRLAGDTENEDMQKTEKEDLQETQKERTCRRHRKRERLAGDTEREDMHSCRRQKKGTLQETQKEGRT